MSRVAPAQKSDESRGLEAGQMGKLGNGVVIGDAAAGRMYVNSKELRRPR